MGLDIERESGVVVCTFDGELTFDTLSSIRDDIEESLEKARIGIIVDLSRVSYLDSAGLSLLMRCHAHMVRTGGKCVFAGVTGNVERVIVVMKLETVLNIVPTLEEARQAIKG